MVRVIQQNENNSKALEVRLEQQGPGMFYVVLAGTSFNMRSGCPGGRCEAAGEDSDVYVANETYMQHRFGSYDEAKTAYDFFRQQYL